MERIWWIILASVLTFCITSRAGKNDYSGALPFCRSRSDLKTNGPNRSLIIVSTLDGRVSAVDAKNGKVVWSLLTGPDTMLSSSISKLEITNNGKWMRLIPSLDGGLFKFDGNSVEALPITAETLLSSSLKLADDMVISGCNENRVYGIDYISGKLLYTCKSSGCKSLEHPDEERDVIVIRRRTHIVRAVDPKTGIERWNYSVGQHEVALIEGEKYGCSSEDIDNDESLRENELSPDQLFYEKLRVKFVPPEGKVIGVLQNDDNNVVWHNEFTSPVIDAWSLHDNSLEQMDLLSTVHLPNDLRVDERNDLSATLYIGMHQKQLYIKQSRIVLDKVINAVYRQSKDETVYPRINWKPYLVTAISRTPIITGNGNDYNLPVSYKPQHGIESTALIIRQDGEYPYDGGFYIFPEETMIETNLIVANKSESEEEETIQVVVIVSLTYWWKELCVFAIIFLYLNYQITRYVWKKRQRLERNNNVINDNSQMKALAALAQIGVSPVIQNFTVEESNKSESEPTQQSKPEEFVSRYLTDFEPIRCLGRGGFGVVFQARNKIDECDYAIKRICLPNRDEAREKVMREVKALAKLDHIGIVRYYNAWMESPPMGWQEKIDKQWEKKGLFSMSNCVTSESPSDLSANPATRNESRPAKRMTNGKNIFQTRSFEFSLDEQFDDSEVHSIFTERNTFLQVSTSERNGDVNSDWLPFNNYKSNDVSDDSFIVFEESGYDGKSSSTEISDADIKFNNKSISEKTILSSGNKRPRSRPNSFNSQLIATEQKLKVPRMYLHIQTQLCKKENLKDWMNINTQPREKIQILDFFDQIVSAVEYVHAQGLMHRDLKPSNIFFAMDGTIKVGDFGLVATMAEGEDQHTPCSDGPIMRHTDKVGTQLYMSPEQIAGKVYSHKVDIFSLGLIFFELLTPFGTQMERLKVLLDVKGHKFPEDFLKEKSEESEFVLQMLSINPEIRPSASEIRQHSLLQVFQPRPEVLRHRRRTLSATHSTSSSE